MFLEEIVVKDGKDGARIKTLHLETDYFTFTPDVLFSEIDEVCCDVEERKVADPVSFSSDGWFSIKSEAVERDDVIVGWRWANISGNQALVSKGSGGLPICEAKTPGTHICLFSLHTVAVTALEPSHGYSQEGNGEFVRLAMFHKDITKSEGGHLGHLTTATELTLNCTKMIHCCTQLHAHNPFSCGVEMKCIAIMVLE